MKKLVFLFLLIPLLGLSQKDPSYYLIKEIDLTKIDSAELESLEATLEKYYAASEDTTKIRIIERYTENCWDQNLWPQYSDFIQEKCVAELPKAKGKYKEFYERMLAFTYSNDGYIHMMQGEGDEALAKFEQSVAINKKYNDESNLANMYNNIASVYDMQGKIEEAIAYFEMTLTLLKKLKMEERIGIIINNLASIYIDNGDIEIAQKYLAESIAYSEKTNDYRSLSISYNNFALIEDDRGNHQEALKYYQKSLSYFKQFAPSKHDIATTTYNVGNMHSELHNYDSAATLINEALVIFKEIEYKKGIANAYRSLGNIELYQGNTKGALSYHKMSFDLAQQIGFPNQISQAAKGLSVIHRKMGNWKDALAMYKLHISMEDSLNNDAAKKAVAKQQAKHEYEKQKALDDAEHEKQLAIEQEAKEKQTILTYATAGGLGLVGIFLLFVFNRLKVTRKQKGIIETAHYQLEEKNQEILDSINYAKRIQSAILPPDKLVKEYLQQSFVLYKPKDIVAGDFYWMEHAKDMVLFAAADCTGHGVPGAMVSVVCNNGLNRSVREHGLTDPGKILDKTREIVVQEFEKSEEEVKDGMDIALCALTTNNNQQSTAAELLYAGAHNPLWIIRSGASEIEEIKADKQPIGKTDNPTPYTTHKVDLNPGDTIYIFSDGYADQFGGEKGKKLKTVNFKKLLLSIKDQDMTAQKQSIDEAFENWKGELEQLDDVCVIGVRL